MGGDDGRRRWEATMGVGADDDDGTGSYRRYWGMPILARIVLEPYLSLKNNQHLLGWPAAFFWRPTAKHGTGRQNTLATVEN